MNSILRKTEIDGTRRPETLQLTEFSRLAAELNKFYD